MSPVTRPRIWFPLAMLLASSPHMASVASPATPWPSIGRELLAAAERERQDKDLPSITLGLVDASGLVWSGAVGSADEARQHAADARTLYRIGSISKLFTDVLAMQLVERGALDLDAPVQKYLPDFKPHNPFGKPITLRQLMSHRSGLVREPPRGSYFDAQAPSLAETVRSLNSTTLVAAPGTLSKYSNAGIAVVGRVLEVVTHKSYEQLMEEALLAPLGMTHTRLRVTPQLREQLAFAQLPVQDADRFTAPLWDLGIAPAGNLYSNIEDMAKFARALLNHGRTDQGAILKPATLDSMWQPLGADGTARRFGIGFGVDELDGHRLVGHGGAVYGYVADLQVFPEDGFAVIVMTALDEATSSLKRLRNFAARQVFAARAGRPPPAYQTSQATPVALAPRIAGHYSDGSQSLEIKFMEGRAYLEAPEVLAELRRMGEQWVLDDVSHYRDDVKINMDTGSVELGGHRYQRASWPKPPPPEPGLAGLIGEYGWDHNFIRVYERDGRPYVRIEWTHFEPLERVTRDVYRFAGTRGLYPRESLRFTRGPDGRGKSVSLNGIVFERRDFGAEAQAHLREGLRTLSGVRAAALAAHPPEESGKLTPDLVPVRSVEPGIKLDIRYASQNNFSGMQFYESAQAFLQRPAAEALARAHRKLAQYGYGILVHDGYRPWYITKMFWEVTPPRSRIYVADPSKGSRHNRGCAADITLYDLATGRALAMTGRYDEMSARSSPLYVGGSSLQRWQRDLLRTTVEAEGFDVYPYEWWHFDFHSWQQYPIINLPFDRIGAQTPVTADPPRH